MKQSCGAWFPDDEADKFMLWNGPKYQSEKLKAAMKYVKKTGLALDIGAHCGLWSMQLDGLFSRVVAFEPLGEHVSCFRKNAPGVELHEAALGANQGMCGISRVEQFSGRSFVCGDGDLPMYKLDYFGFTGVDLIKVDAEGYELFILQGGEQTIVESKPVLIVEQKPGNAERFGLGEKDAIEYLKGLGAVLREEIAGDYILSWD